MRMLARFAVLCTLIGIGGATLLAQTPDTLPEGATSLSRVGSGEMANHEGDAGVAQETPGFGHSSGVVATPTVRTTLDELLALRAAAVTPTPACVPLNGRCGAPGEVLRKCCPGLICTSSPQTNYYVCLSSRTAEEEPIL